MQVIRSKESWYGRDVQVTLAVLYKGSWRPQNRVDKRAYLPEPTLSLIALVRRYGRTYMLGCFVASARRTPSSRSS